MTAVFKTRGYRISYFKNENQSGNPYDDEVYLDDLENFEWEVQKTMANIEHKSRNTKVEEVEQDFINTCQDRQTLANNKLNPYFTIFDKE